MSNVRSTNTLAALQVLPSTYAEIRSRLERAGYADHFFTGMNMIDMTGIALEPRPARVLTTDDDVRQKLREGHYDDFAPPHAALFRRDALRFVGLDDHPRANLIFAFASSVGLMTPTDIAGTTLAALEQIAAFMGIDEL
jgi:hypothetical protein